MYGRGVRELMEALPALDGIDDDGIRRLLTGAWLDAANRRDLGGLQGSGDFAVDLRRLGAALEVHALIAPDVSAETLRAAAFVAAEAIDVAREITDSAGVERDATEVAFERAEVGLLYLIAGYDANAAVTNGSSEIPIESLETACVFALEAVRALTRLSEPPEEPALDLDDGAPLRERVRDGLWRTIARLTSKHLEWLRDPDVDAATVSEGLRALADRLSTEGGLESAEHPDIHQFALLLSLAVDSTSERAIREVTPPPGDDGGFEAFIRRRCERQPLLWPAAKDYAVSALPGPSRHAVVAVPTGAGKSGVADLAIAQAVQSGWVLVLAPTNALTGQIRRQLRADLAPLEGVQVREFLGGSEYAPLAGEALNEIDDRQVLVMTPEKCSLALRQSPEAFGRLSLCVVDEAHQLGQSDQRAVVAELVVSEILDRSPEACFLMMSALIANPERLAEWLSSASNTESVVIREPWRPTRTLRAVAGYDFARLDENANRAAEELGELPDHRVGLNFESPAALLAGLQGAWESESDEDYVLAPTNVLFPGRVERDRTSGEMSFGSSGYVRPAVQAFAQHLGDRGHRVMAFLPQNKHYSFAAARDLEGFDLGELSESVDALLTLGDAELGAPSLLRTTLSRGVGVHTSALLAEERRASELAFSEGTCRVLFATGTLAQGLNLPATVVLIGGTTIGFDQEAPPDELRARQRAQLLNAIGRAGRAQVAARSMALVIPNDALLLRADTVATDVLPRAEFLSEEDASTEIESQLRSLVNAAVSGGLNVEGMTVTEQTAFSVLSAPAEPATAVGILRRSWGAQRVGVPEQAEEIADQLRSLGSSFLEAADAPEWVATAAHLSGTRLLAAAHVHRALRAELEQAAPTDVMDWCDLMLRVLRSLSLPVLRTLLRERSLASTTAEAIFSDIRDDRPAGWDAFEGSVRAWLSGADILSVAAPLHEDDVAGESGRSGTDPIPRTLRVIQNGFSFELAAAAGLLTAIVDTGIEHEGDEDAPWHVPEESYAALSQLPLSIRFGAADYGALALLRAGARPRTVAHTINRLSPPPPGAADEAIMQWAWRCIARLDEVVAEDAAEEDDLRVLGAFGRVRTLT